MNTEQQLNKRINQLEAALSASVEREDKLQEALANKDKDDVFVIRIPNLRPDEILYVRGQISKFTKEMLSVLTVRKRQRN